MTLRILTYIVLLLTFAGATAKEYPHLEFDRRPAATVGLLIVDLDTKDTICQENVDRGLIPASILKLVVSAASLEKRGPDFVYETKIGVRGGRYNQFINGDLVIIPSGDPTIESEYFGSDTKLIPEIVDSLKNAGIERICGRIIVDQHNYLDLGYNPHWEIDDRSHAYGAGYYGFNYSDNITTIRTADNSTSPEVPNVSIWKTLAKGKTRLEHTDSNTYVIRGKGLNKPSVELRAPIDDPSQVFVHNLTAALRDAGIEVTNWERPNIGTVNILFTHKSPVNSDILRSLMHRSDNMMAEATLRSLDTSKINTRTKSIDRLRDFLKRMKIDLRDTDILDGSGLSRANQVTPRLISDVLGKMAKANLGSQFVSLFPRVGQDGTVNTFLRNSFLEGKLVLKSGSLKGVFCFAGYLLDDNDKPTHSVVLMVNNFTCPRNSLRNSVGQFFENIFNFKKADSDK